MNYSRIKIIKKNILFSLINKVVSLVLPFIVRTILIYNLGSIYLGLNGLFVSILNILSLAELGVGSAMVFSMYEPIAKDEKVIICALLNLYRKTYFCIGIVVFLIGIVFMPFLPNIIKDGVPVNINIYILYLIYLLNSSISYFLFAYKESLLIANQRIDVSSNISTIISVSMNFFQVIVLIYFKSYYVYCIIIPISTLCRNLVVNFVANKMYPQYKCDGDLPKKQLLDIKKRVLGLFLYRVSNVFRDSFDSIVISSFLGLTILAKFNNYNYIITTVTGFFAILKNSITSTIGLSIVTDSIEKNHMEFELWQFIYLWISSWCMACLICLFQPFISIWIGNDYLLSINIVWVFGIYFYSYKLGDICAVYRQAAGLWWQDKFRPIVEAVLNLFLNIILVKQFGVVGVLLSSIFCLLFINSIWASHILYKNYFFNFSQIIYIKKVWYYLFIAIIASLSSYLVCQLITDVSYLGLIYRLVICTIVSNIVMIIGFFWMDEFKNTKTMVKKILNNKNI